MKLGKFLAIFAAIAFLLMPAISTPAQDKFKSPDDVKTALKLLVQVSNDFKRQITAKNFARIPHENMEYHEAADALRTALKDDDAKFKARAEARLKAAVAEYQKISDMSTSSPDADKLMAEHMKAVTAMNALFDLFPADFRPDPNLPPPGRGRAPAAN